MTHCQLDAKQHTCNEIIVQNTTPDNRETGPSSRVRKPLNQWQRSVIG